MSEVVLIQIGSPAFKAILENTAKQAARTASEETQRLMEEHKEPPFVKRERAMEILGVGSTKFRELKNAGEISFTEGRKAMFETQSLYNYLHRSKRKAS